MDDWTAAPIRWQNTGDGEYPFRADLGADALVLGVNDFPADPLYTLYANGSAVVDLEDWPSAWLRPGRVVDGLLLLAWATRLCRVESTDSAVVLRALAVQLTPPTDGFARLAVGEDSGGFFYLEGEFARTSLTRASLDETFGAGNELPRVHYDRPHVVAYRVEVADAPHYVDVFARFTEPPAPAAPAISATLRRTRHQT